MNLNQVLNLNDSKVEIIRIFQFELEFFRIESDSVGAIFNQIQNVLRIGT